MFSDKFWQHVSQLGSGVLIAVVIFWGFNQFANRIAETNQKQAETLQEVSNTMVVLQENFRESSQTQKTNQERIIKILSRMENQVN